MPRTALWLDAIPETLRRRGYPSLRAAGIDHPYLTWEQLGRVLELDQPPAGVLLFARYEAVASGDIGFYLREDLARRLHQFLPEGWGAGRDARARASEARDWWDHDAVPGLRARCQRAWTLLRRSRPPRYWRPAGGMDPRLIEVWTATRPR